MNPATEEKAKESLTLTTRSASTTVAYQQCANPPSDNAFIRILQRDADQKHVQKDATGTKNASV